MPLVSDTKDILRKVERVANERAKAKQTESPRRKELTPSRQDRTSTRLDVSASKTARDKSSSSATRKSVSRMELESSRSHRQQQTSKSPSGYTSSRVGRKSAMEKSPIRNIDKENVPASFGTLKRSVLEPETKVSIQESEMDAEDERLLKSLAVKCEQQYDPAKLTNEFMSIVNNNRKGTRDFMPQGRCQQQKDGRNCMRVGDVDIFFDESILGEILNYGLRSKVSFN